VDVTSLTARNGDVELAVERVGDQSGEPLLLIMGLGTQMIFWPDELCAQLTAAGFAVARMDNRDVGLSTHLDQVAGPTSILKVLVNPAKAAGYSLGDMADDCASVLDALDWPSAHVVGASLGGMIAQTLACRHPDRVRSLTSIMSTPSPSIGRPAWRAMRVLLTKPAADREAAGRRSAAVFRAIGSTGYPVDEPWLRDAAARAYDRAGGSGSGPLRQLAAIRAGGDRRAELAELRVPTLVLHGDSDPMIRPVGGRATAAAIPGARLVTFPGMGHDLPVALWPQYVAEIRALAFGSG
jgi:pimeloyl-ACP methyl ester carboxylesterase